MRILISMFLAVGVILPNLAQASDCTISTSRKTFDIGYESGYVRVYFATNWYISYCGGTLGPSDSLTINLTSGEDNTVSACNSSSAYSCGGFQPSSGDFADITIYAGAGNDTIKWLGSDIPAFIYGEGGSDDIYGGTASDWLDGGDGCDIICSLEGDDVIFLGSLFGSDGCAGTNYANGPALECFNSHGFGSDTIFGSYGDDEIAGQDGDDYIWGGPGSDLIVGLWGTDILDGGPGDDFITGGFSTESSEFSLGGPDLLIGNDGADTLIGNPVSGDCLCGENCYSTSSAGDGDDTMIAWSGNDYLCDANTYDADTFTCGDGTDIWYVNCANDSRTNCETYSSSACSYCLNWASESAESQVDAVLARAGTSKAELDSCARAFASSAEQ